jgi:hypothetical protein
MNDVVIGDGEYGNSAISVPGFTDLSENRVSYWVGNVYMGLGAVVLKDTGAGAKIKALVDQSSVVEQSDGKSNSKNEKRIKKFLEGSVISGLSVDQIKQLVNRSYRDGRQDKLQEIRECLGIR